MKKHIIFLTLSTFLFILFTGCSNLFQKTEDEDVSQTIELNFYINDYKADSNASESERTILPAAETGSSVEKIVLEGLHSKNSSGEDISGAVYEQLGSWNSYSTFCSSTIEVSPGVWSFKLSCYKTEDSTEKLFAAAQIADKTLTFTDDGESPAALAFNLSYADNVLAKGAIEIKVNVPEGITDHAEVSLYTLTGGIKNTVTLSKSSYAATETGDSSGYKAFTIRETGIQNGYYFLELKFYTDATTTPTATKVEYVKIAGGQTSIAALTYANLNKRYTVTYHAMAPEGETVTEPSSFTYNSSTKVTLASLSAANYDFLGWYEDSAYTIGPITQWSAGDKSAAVDLYAKWKGNTYTVTYYDFAGGQSTGKTYSGTTMPATLDYGTDLTAEAYVPAYDSATNGALSDSNEVVFAGWYKDMECTAANKITKFDGSSTLYAKWNYKYVYVDPQASNSGADTNRGYLPAEPLKTIAEAKTYLKNNTLVEKVYLMSFIRITSPSDTANNPSDLTTEENNNAILQRYSTCKNSMIIIACTTYELKNITFDGGAVWDENGASGVNTGLKAGDTESEGALFTIYNADLVPDVTFSQKVVIQNNENTCSSRPGGGVRLYGKLTINSSDCQIRCCSSIASSGAIHIGSGSNLTINKGIIGGLSKADSNYTDGCGAGLRCVSGSASTTSTVNIGSSSIAADGSELIIANNYTSDSGVGGGIYITSECTLNIENAKIINNKAKNGAGIYVCGLDETAVSSSTVTATNIFVEDNEASLNGGGIYLGYGDNGCSKYIQTGGTISNNKAAAGAGVTTSSILANCMELSDITMSGNCASDNAGAIYVTTGRFIQLNNTTVTNNTCAATGLGGGIYSVGTVKLGGTIDISNNHQEGNSAESNVYLLNSSAARYLKLISDVSTASGKTKVATVHMPEAKYPTTIYDSGNSNSYVKILSEDTGAGYVAQYYNLFSMEKTDYSINSSGQVFYDKTIPPTSGGLSYTEDNITITLDKSAIATSSSTKLNISAYADKGTASEKVLTGDESATDWEIVVMRNGSDVSGSGYFTITNTSSERSIVCSAGMPSGLTLQLYVAFTYNGKKYGGTLNLTVEDK